MPDQVFAHPRLAPLYDAFEEPRDDLDAYLGIVAELGASRVVDLGCGTGSLALLLAAAGREVIGVDPAGASLDVARAKPGAAVVTWINGDAGAIPTDARADLTVMTGNAAQAVVSDQDWALLLRQVHAGLCPGAWFVFETRRPQRRAWLDWATETAPEVRDFPGVGTVEQRTELTSVDLPLVSFRSTYRFLRDGSTLVSESTLRFRDRAEVTDSLAGAGFTVREVREAPDRPGHEYVFLAQRS